MATMHEEKESKHHFPHAARSLVDAEIVNTNTKKYSRMGIFEKVAIP